MKKKYIVAIVFIACIISAELFLRLYYGFCDTVVMKEDPDYEYIPSPDQHRFRFRHYVDYNSESMRSDEVDSSSTIILGFGDSVINGGVQTDQDSLATTLLSDSLTKRLHKKVQFLNISAGSWGPDNCFAYLKKHGDFSAQSVFLFVSSHDAYDNMDFNKIVGINKNFPDKQSYSAIYELVARYLMPRLKQKLNIASPEEESLGINKQKLNSGFNTGFKDFLEYTMEKKLPFTLYLHAEMTELKAGAYNKQGQEIIRFAKANNIPIITDLDKALETSDFRDNIHPSLKGQKKLANNVLQHLKD